MIGDTDLRGVPEVIVSAALDEIFAGVEVFPFVLRMLPERLLNHSSLRYNSSCDFHISKTKENGRLANLEDGAIYNIHETNLL